MENLESNEPTVEEPVNVMDAWNYLHQKMWEQVELERWYAEKCGKEFTLDHPEKIFGPNALKTPWDKAEPLPEQEGSTEELNVATLQIEEDIIFLELGKMLDDIEPPIGWDVVDTSVPEEPQPEVVEPVAEEKPKAKPKSKSKKKKD